MKASSKMKFIGAALIAAAMMSSCLLPSLHPIYTEDTREIDDRIIGTWVDKKASGQEFVEKMYSIQSEFEGIKFDTIITVEGDTTLTINATNVPNDRFDKSASEFWSTNYAESTWTFERAANVTFEEYKSESDNSTINMSVGAPSFKPEGYKLIAKSDHPFYFLTHQEIENQDTIITRLFTNLTNIGGNIYLDFVPHKIKRGLFGGNNISAHSFAKLTFEDDNLSLEMFDGDFIEDLIKNRRVRLRHEKIGDGSNIVLTASTKELRSFIEKYGDQPELFDNPQEFTKL